MREIHLIIFSLILMAGFIGGCAYQFPEVESGPQLALREINEAENLVIHKKFSKAEKKLTKMMETFPKGTREHEIVLYNLILINMNLENPHRNNKKASEYTKEFCSLYPHSHYRTSLSLIKKMCSNTVDLVRYKREVAQLKKDLQIKESRIKKLRTEIEEYKKIDWEREEKKRQLQKQ